MGGACGRLPRWRRRGLRNDWKGAAGGGASKLHRSASAARRGPCCHCSPAVASIFCSRCRRAAAAATSARPRQPARRRDEAASSPAGCAASKADRRWAAAGSCAAPPSWRVTRWPTRRGFLADRRGRGQRAAGLWAMVATPVARTRSAVVRPWGREARRIGVGGAEGRKGSGRGRLCERRRHVTQAAAIPPSVLLFLGGGRPLAARRRAVLRCGGLPADASRAPALPAVVCFGAAPSAAAGVCGLSRLPGRPCWSTGQAAGAAPPRGVAPSARRRHPPRRRLIPLHLNLALLSPALPPVRVCPGGVPGHFLCGGGPAAGGRPRHPPPVPAAPLHLPRVGPPRVCVWPPLLRPRQRAGGGGGRAAAGRRRAHAGRRRPGGVRGRWGALLGRARTAAVRPPRVGGGRLRRAGWRTRGS